MTLITSVMFLVASCHWSLSLRLQAINLRATILDEATPQSLRGIEVAWTDCLPCVNVSSPVLYSSLINADAHRVIVPSE